MDSATLNPLELGANFSDRYRKVQADTNALEDIVLKSDVRCLPSKSEVLILDFDATDNPLHEQQEGRFFTGIMATIATCPFNVFLGPVPLWAEFRESNKDASHGVVEAQEKIVAAIRKHFPKARVVVRADSGFSRESIMAWRATRDWNTLPAGPH